MDKKTSFVIYAADFLAAVHNFKKNQIADLIIALCEYNLYGASSLKLSGLVKERFDALQDNINLCNAKYKEICEKRKANGSKGGSKRQAKNKQTSSNAQAILSTLSPGESEKEKESESDYEKDKKKDKEAKAVDKSGFVGAPSVEEVAAYCETSGYTIDPVAFVRWNEERGWMNGKKYIALDWRKAVRKWFNKENGISASNLELMADVCADMLSKAKAV